MSKNNFKPNLASKLIEDKLKITLVMISLCCLPLITWCEEILCPSYQTIMHVQLPYVTQMDNNQWMIKSNWFTDAQNHQWYAAILWVPAANEKEAMKHALVIQKTSTYLPNPSPVFSDQGFVACDYNGASLKPPGSEPLIDAVHFNLRR